MIVDFKEIKSTFEQMSQDIEAIGSEVVATKNWREQITSALGAVDNSIGKFSEFKTELAVELEDQKSRIEELEGRAKTPSKGGTRGGRKTLAALMQADDGFKNFLAGKTGSVKLEFAGLSMLREYKADLTSSIGAGSPSSTIPLQALRLGGFANNPQRRLRIIDVLPHQPITGTNSYEWLKLEDAYSPNAQVQTSEGAAKAESQIPVTLQNGTLITIATYCNVSTQLLSDYSSLSGILQDLLIYAVLLRLESEVIVGGSALVTGLLEAAPTAMVNTKTSRADKIGEAAATLASAGWNPDTVLLNPLDEFEIESEKAVGGDEQYVSPPTGGKFWRLNPIGTPTIAQGTALVFDSSQATIYDREQINVLIGTVNDQFTRNMRTLLVEGRFGFSFRAPNAIKRVSI